MKKAITNPVTKPHGRVAVKNDGRTVYVQRKMPRARSVASQLWKELMQKNSFYFRRDIM